MHNKPLRILPSTVVADPSFRVMTWITETAIHLVTHLLIVNALGVFSDPSVVQLSESFGGPHGKDFSDENDVSAGQIIGSITLHVGKRCHGLELQVAAPVAQTFTHGGDGGTLNTLTLNADEYITSMEAHWGKHKGHTRIFYLSFGTSDGKSVSGGSMTDSKSTVTAPEGFQLGGFFGRQGDELDLLGAIWTRIEAVTAAPVVDSPGTVAPADIQDPVTKPPGSTKIGRRATLLSESFGGPHGDQFSDQSSVKSGQKVKSLTLHIGNRCHGLELQIAEPVAASFAHGGEGGNYKTLTLREDEYITSMEAHWGKKDDRTRIFYLSFGTNFGITVSGGTKTDTKNSVSAPVGYQLGGFFGRDGDEIDLIGVVWSSIEVVEETPVSAVSADEDIQLSEVFGGPHGIAFSDINSIKLSQTVSTIALRTGDRCHGLSLGISSPKDAMFSHGGDGGKENTLTLAPGEYITSMEAHWGKKNGHTRIFHLTFTTNAGHSIAGGGTTDDKSIVTAPEGFQLSGFHGRSESEIDQLGVIWTRIGAKDIELMDMPGSDNAQYADAALSIVEGIVKQAITNGDEILSSGKNALNLLTGSSVLNDSSTTVDELQDLINKKSKDSRKVANAEMVNKAKQASGSAQLSATTFEVLQSTTTGANVCKRELKLDEKFIWTETDQDTIMW
ncbi:hypothetical protein PC115_g17780 [Phytophthora cactorum]|uniref:Jacalin-type lectin domain-containing protein n=1 Tax=Phytophthora cactorum TaxID=29920 RepID=A0A8T1B735_9STRA|nr:hypothetical protein PC115_g17780 [Phytophthora cactorum]